MACVTGVPAGSEDLGPRGTAASSLIGHRCEVAPALLTSPARPAADAWRDAEGTPISLQSRVAQVVVDTEHGALPCRLHQQGRGIGGLVYVLFEHGNQLIALRPHLVRVLDTPDGG
jgi:hypothetical protein